MFSPWDYAAAKPFPHLVLKDAWLDDRLDQVAAEFPDPSDWRWRRYDAEQERKLEGGADCWGPATRDIVAVLGGQPWLAMLHHLTGIDDLSVGLEGAGMHAIERGGYLLPHVDFDRSTDGLYRRLNVLVFLNRDYRGEYGGALELWGDDGPEVEIAPTFNTTVIFSSSRRSYHGHPRPWTGPLPRRSLAAYYFAPISAEPAASPSHSTIWRDR